MKKTKPKGIRKVLRIIGRILLALVLVLMVALGVLTAAEYRPAERENLIAYHEADPVFQTGDTVTLVSWNCGYGALGDNADFFMDGGSSVYTADRDRVARNLEGIRDTLSGMEADLIILQEVDVHSDRSYGTDERTRLREVIPDGADVFAYNFKSLYVPYPIPPIGHVESGLYTLSRADIREADRISLPCPFSWPIRIVNLKRCLLVSRIPVAGTDRELVLINLHLEAYDNGEGKEAQTRQLQALMQQEYEAGNYVIAGGDFNQRFTNIDQSQYPVYEGMWQPGEIEAEAFGGDFTLLMDPSAPTCRSLDRAYAGEDPEGFQFYMIDGFIVSSNIKVESVETIDTQFVCSDHNPVRLRFALKED